MFLSYTSRHKYSYALGVIFLFSTNWLAVNIPTYIGRSIDLLGKTDSADFQRLQENVYWLIGFAALMMLSRTVSRMLFFNPGRLIERDLKNDAFSKLTQLQQGFYSRNPVGSLISIINNDVNGVRAMTGVGMMNVFNILFSLSMTPLQMWRISPTLTFYCLIPMLVAFIAVRYAIKLLRMLLQQRMQHLQTLSTQTVNFLNGVDVIKSYDVQDWALEQFSKSNRDILKVSIKQLRIRTFVMPLLEYAEAILKILILGIGGWHLIQADITLGELTAFLAYAGLLAMPFMSLGRLILTIQTGIVSLKSIAQILNQSSKDDVQLDKPLDEIASQKEVFTQGLQVRNLNYQYPSVVTEDEDEQQISKRPFALKNISFDIKPGEKVAILGRVGSGKSTLVNCLNRLHELPTGMVFIDGMDVTKMPRQSLRNIVRTVTQEPFLFSDTLKNNVLFGGQASSSISLEQALEQSAMAKEVALFPDGVDTLVGEKGILLSGGQKQRISLARAMHNPAQLMILDNVLSALDNETERFVLRQIFEKLSAQSCLIVSHRQAVLEQVDHILLLEKGEIVARGNHHTLLKESAIYAETWHFLQTTTEQEEEREEQLEESTSD